MKGTKYATQKVREERKLGKEQQETKRKWNEGNSKTNQSISELETKKKPRKTVDKSNVVLKNEQNRQ